MMKLPSACIFLVPEQFNYACQQLYINSLFKSNILTTIAHRFSKVPKSAGPPRQYANTQTAFHVVRDVIKYVSEKEKFRKSEQRQGGVTKHGQWTCLIGELFVVVSVCN